MRKRLVIAFWEFTPVAFVSFAVLFVADTQGPWWFIFVSLFCLLLAFVIREIGASEIKRLNNEN